MMAIDGTPRWGDVVVRKEKRDGIFVYVLRIAPETDHEVLTAREEAVAQGLLLAERQHVCVWMTDNWVDFDVLEDFRTVRSA